VVGLDSYNLGYLLRGLVFGMIGVGLGSILPATRRRPLACAMVGGALAAAASAHHPLALVVGTAGLVVAGSLAPRLPRGIALVASSVLVGLSVGGPLRLRKNLPRPIGVALAVPIAAIAFERFASRAHRWEPALYAVVSLGGVWAAVPDTEMPLVVAGAALPGLVLSVLWPEGTIASGASFVGLLLWAAAEGARGRPAAFLAAIGCLGLLLVAPVADWASRSVGPHVVRLPRVASNVVRFGLHVAVVVVCARVAGPLVSRSDAAIVTGAALAGGGLLTWIVAPDRGETSTQAVVEA
jgi:hypothetical protein